jgi:hypothetical protein
MRKRVNKPGTLSPLRLGIAGGIIWSVSMFICTILAINIGYSEKLLEVMVGIYPGYSISAAGAVLGLVYGFIDGFAGFFLLAWIYNKLSKI